MEPGYLCPDVFVCYSKTFRTVAIGQYTAQCIAVEVISYICQKKRCVSLKHVRLLIEYCTNFLIYFLRGPSYHST
jgi:hypothetical protein